jgi:hypothetical protein
MGAEEEGRGTRKVPSFHQVTDGFFTMPGTYLSDGAFLLK